MAGAGRARRGGGRPRPQMPSRSLELLVAAMVKQQLAIQQPSVQQTAAAMHGGPTAHLLSSPPGPHIRPIVDTVLRPVRPLLSSSSSGASPEPPTPSSSLTAHFNYPRLPLSPRETVQEAMAQLLLSPPSAALMPPPLPSARTSSLSRVHNNPSHGQSTGGGVHGLTGEVVNFNDDRSRHRSATPLGSASSYGPHRDHVRHRRDPAHGYYPRSEDASSTDDSDWSRPSSSSSPSQNEQERRIRSTTYSMRTLRHQSSNVRHTKKIWALRATLEYETWQTLSVPAFVIRDLSSSDTHVTADPTMEQLQRGAEALQMDLFTHSLWVRHAESHQQYGIKSVVPDSFYVNAVKELHQPGHIWRSALNDESPLLFKALEKKWTREARYMLFDPPTSSETGYAQGMPLLALVRSENLALKCPSYGDCVRVIPISQVRAVLHQLHKLLGHKIVAIAHHVHERYSGIPREVCELYQNHCLPCKQAVALDRKKVKVKPIAQRWARYRYVADLITMRSVVANDGATYAYILVMVDHFSRFRWAKPLRNKMAAGVVKALGEWWQEWGKPQVFQSDNGLEFAAAEVRDLCRRWGVRKRHSRPHHPATNGAVERGNRDVEDSIVKLEADNPEETWVDLLGMAVNNHNWAWSRVHKAAPRTVFSSATLDWEATRPLAAHAVPDANDWGRTPILTRTTLRRYLMSM